MDITDEIKQLNCRIDNLDQKIDEILALLRPVSAHAGFVDDLKQALYNSKIVRVMCGNPKSNNNRFLHLEHQAKRFWCNLS